MHLKQCNTLKSDMIENLSGWLLSLVHDFRQTLYMQPFIINIEAWTVLIRSPNQGEKLFSKYNSI